MRLDDWRSDLVFAIRVLVRNPGFAAAATVALALAIGANTTVFTLANAFLFKNLPFAEAGRIVYVSSRNPRTPGPRTVSYPDFSDYRDQVRSLAGAGAMSTGTVDVSDGVALPEPYRCANITANAFAVVGQRPVLGRDFQATDELPGQPRVAILGDGLWRARYGADPAIVGRTIRINDIATTIVGVMPPRFTFPGASDLWLPLVRTPAFERRGSRSLTMFGRLAPDASLNAVQAEMSVIAARLAAQYPATNADLGVLVETFNDRYNSGQTGRLLYWLLWAVLFVLLIACANVANLLLSRAVVRSREICLRASLGATRWRVVRQLLVESLLLALAGGAGGALLGYWGVRLFDAALVPAVKPAHIDFSIDARVVLYLIGITVGSALAFGLAPALQLSSLDLATAMKQGGGSGLGPRTRRMSAALVVAEVALAVVLLTGAGLMTRSFLNTTRADIGIEPANLMSFSVNLRRTKYPSVDRQASFYEQLKTRLETVPGVRTMAVASDLPAESPDEFDYEIEGTAPGGQERRRAMGLLVGDGYFRTLGIRTSAGREFLATDTPGTPPIAIVNETFARQAWPRQDAVGKRFRITARDGDPQDAEPWRRVAGVVADVLQDDESFEVAPVIYLPYRQRPESGMELLLRTSVPPAAVADAIRREVRALDDDLAVRGLRPMEESLWLRNWRHRIFGAMFTIFGIIALVLAAVGLAAVIAHSVSQRTREIGVRRTLGATSAQIAALVFGQALRRVGAGLLLGVAGALGATGVLESMLVGVTPGDPLTLAGVSMLLAAAAALGCAIPALRAVHIDPAAALRAE